MDSQLTNTKHKPYNPKDPKIIKTSVKVEMESQTFT